MKKILLSSVIAFALTACSTSKEANQPLEVWNNFQQPAAVSTDKLGENQSLVVFYRENDIQGPAANVYVNGNYQTSLLPNAFSPIAVCAAKNLFTSSFTTTAAFGNRTQGVYYTTPVKQITYVKVVQERNGKLTFVEVDSDVAQQVIANLPKENQTLSRVPAPTHCGEPVLANTTLDANALFAFNKSGYRDILPAGKESINDFVKGLSTLSGVSKISVVVSGHSDPVGSERYNQALSQKRANTVKAELQKSGITLPIEAVGYGKSQPVVTHCDTLKGKEKQACNQPNRRVEITVYGAK